MASRMFLRSMATSAQAVKAPVQLFGVDGTYATALYTAAVKISSVEAANKSLTSIETLLKEDKKVGEFLSNPALALEDRKAITDVLASKLSLDSSVKNLLTVLAENNRLANFNSIYKEFQILNDAHNGVVEATVTSATPLDSRILKRIQQSISKSSYVGSSQTLKVSNKVNPEILGGLIVEVADRTVDLSISSKVSKLNQAISESI